MEETNRPLGKSGRDEPPSRKLHFSSRENSEFKWKHDKTVIGALEVPSEPVLHLTGHYKEHSVMGYEEDWQKCLQLWKDFNLKESFVKAFEGLSVETKCCGLITDMDSTIKHHVPILNHGWAKQVNDELLSKEGYRISLFVWSWSNPTGKAETVIPMIRFHSLHISIGKGRD
ncbi:hypothetical protein IV203_014394 [Nitzschia inconspicua]|uniref:Uncharacterized protein n=1 Tax=Nitzschia inconspicua TaxID=303405 RepID=A0A9K3PSB7_9STRA|nr:hypothetical protein IV203_014394 [Nitzschia inconspicua]